MSINLKKYTEPDQQNLCCEKGAATGKNADFVVFDAPNVEYLMYHFGINHTQRVYKNGKLVVDDKVAVYNKKQ